MIYTIDPTSDEPIMLINKHIGFDEDDGMGIDGSLFQMELLQLDTLGKKRIQIWINSPGGVVSDGYSIYSAMLKSKTPVDTYCMGAAASIAGVLFLAGRKRVMADYSWLMYHNPFYAGDGKKEDDALKTFRESIVTMIERRCGMNEAQVTDMMKRTSYIQADEALRLKLCDEIDSTVELNTKYLRKITDQLQFRKECNKVVNSLLNNSNSHTMTLTKVTMRLKLNDAAREDDIVNAIDAIENRATVAEGQVTQLQLDIQNKDKKSKSELDKMKADMEDLQKQLDAKKKEFQDAKDALDAMEKDKKEAEDKATEEKAKNMVEGFAKAGRIKNEATEILKWTKLAKANFDETKGMIEALPLNKVADKITNLTPNKLEAGALPTTAMGLAVRNRLKREGKA